MNENGSGLFHSNALSHVIPTPLPCFVYSDFGIKDQQFIHKFSAPQVMQLLHALCTCAHMYLLCTASHGLKCSNTTK